MTAPTYVFNIQHYSLHDGPGIRTIVFLKGCPMRCRWCCNPESQSYTPELAYAANRCIGAAACGHCKTVCPQQALDFGDDGKAVVQRERCSQCQACVSACPARALQTEGKLYTVQQLLDIVEKDAVFYEHGEGGLTVSGGEPLSHPEFLAALLEGAKKRHIHTAIETCGNAPYAALQAAAPFLDTILFDIKSMNSARHKEYTGWGNEQILANFTALCRDFPAMSKWVRTPVIPGFNDTPEDIRAIREFLKGIPNVTYEALPYHQLGRGKYIALGRDYPMGDAALGEDMRRYIELVNYDSTHHGEQ
ncbi:glycyl-radical enzyme activating protein [uncultured Megasphaera sp.]|uniref:glycyl-radical enzyme activating protein n=1 Tax=uncultured Megasphaera sp. TaxID=165188 RepID=UPI0026590644|nr:glycyl-radical enzyme activating protein [uncultured Megasphaera sp.]